MLEAIDIHKFFGDLHVLKGVDLKVARGEVVAIVGRSGAGKSTFLHILGTLDRASKGRLLISGKEVGSLSAKELAAFRNKHIGFVFQFHHLLPEFTAWENVCLPAYIGGVSESAAKAKAKELLVYLGLNDRLEHKPTELSGGEQQRVAVARALINEPAIVFADEPSGNLDSASSKALHELLFRLRDDFGQAFVLVTHNEELAGMSDRRLNMADGQLG